MNIFITGGTGVLGKRVLKQLILQNHTVRVLSRSSSNDAEISSAGAQPVRADIFNVSQLKAAMDGCEVIIHLATQIPKKALPKRKDWYMNDRLRTEATQNLLIAAKECGVNKIIVPSIVALYGHRNGESVTSESTLPIIHNVLVQSAYDMEQILIRDTLDYIILRFGTYFGEDCHHTVQMVRDVLQRKMPLIGRGNFFMNLIHVEDAANALVHSLSKFDTLKNQIINVSDFSPQMYSTLLSTVVTLAGAKNPLTIQPWLAKLIMAHSYHVITSSFKVERHDKLIGWEPVRSFEQTIRNILQG